MLRLLERNIASIQRRLVLIAPPYARIPVPFSNVTTDPSRHAKLFAEMQRLRGHVYVSDGAISPDHLSPTGRHQTPEDEQSWHLLLLNGDGRLNSCIWYLEHPNPSALHDLRVKNCALASHDQWRGRFQRAMQQELDWARQNGLRSAEAGGWAVSPSGRCTSEGFLLALAAYSLAQLFGGALAFATATVRHSSSTILRRLGGRPVESGGVPLPTYYDPRYGCDMELLRFDSRRSNPKYSLLIDLLTEQLRSAAVVSSAGQQVIRKRQPSYAA